MEPTSSKPKYENTGFDKGNEYDSLHAAVPLDTNNISNYDHLGENRNPRVEDEYAVVNKTPAPREKENSTMQNMIYESGNYDSLNNQQKQTPNVILNDTYDSLDNHNKPQQQQPPNVMTNDIYDSLDQQQVNSKPLNDNYGDEYDNLHGFQDRNRSNSNVIHNDLYGSLAKPNADNEGQHTDTYDNLQHNKNVTASPNVVEDEYAVVDKSGMKNNNKNNHHRDSYDNLQHNKNFTATPNIVEDEYAVVDKSGMKNNNKNNHHKDSYDNLQHNKDFTATPNLSLIHI